MLINISGDSETPVNVYMILRKLFSKTIRATPKNELQLSVDCSVYLHVHCKK